MALNEFTAEFARKPLQFLRIYTINPPSQDDPPMRRQQDIPINDSVLRFFSKRSVIQNDHARLHARFRSAEASAPIGWIDIKPDPIYCGGSYTFDLEFAEARVGARDYTEVSADFEGRVDEKNRLPVFYLPWMPDQVTRMNIPQYRTENSMKFADGVEIDPYCPHIFFTAGLTGCSVFVYGDPRKPTVAHAGTTSSTPYGGDCASFWRELLFIERMQRLQHEGIAHEVNVDDYMGYTSAWTDFKSWIEKQKSEFVVEEVNTMGTVFGIRYGALWSFYLQENAVVWRHIVRKVIQTQKKTKKGWISWFDKTINEDVEVTVKADAPRATIPLRVRALFPQGSRHAALGNTFEQSYR